MADSPDMAKDIKEWIRSEFLPKKFKQPFAKRKLGIQSGGEIFFENVSEDGKIVCFVSTESGKTKEGLANVRSDALWALALNEKPDTVVFVFTDPTMIELVKKEKDHGRFPKYMKTLLMKLPGDK
jgi:hypothetical protein